MKLYSDESTAKRALNNYEELRRYNLIRAIVGWAIVGLIIAVAFFASGCTALQTTQGNLEKAAETVVAPEEFEIHYKRDGNTTHYLKRACSGDYCENLPDGPGQ